jgi:NADH dehydrogenase
MASPAAGWLGAAHDGAGRVIVERNLTLPDHPDIFVIGDTACVPGPDGKPLPGVAPVAKQQGLYVAQSMRARLAGASVAPFHYRHLGSLATIGRGRAVADFGWIRLPGRLAWLLWGLCHGLRSLFWCATGGWMRCARLPWSRCCRWLSRCQPTRPSLGRTIF